MLDNDTANVHQELAHDLFYIYIGDHLDIMINRFIDQTGLMHPIR